MFLKTCWVILWWSQSRTVTSSLAFCTSFEWRLWCPISTETPALSVMSSSFRASTSTSNPFGLYELVRDSITIYRSIPRSRPSRVHSNSKPTYHIKYISDSAMPRLVFSESDRAFDLCISVLSLFIGSEIHALARSWQIGFSIRRALRVPTEYRRCKASESEKRQIIA